MKHLLRLFLIASSVAAGSTSFASAASAAEPAETPYIFLLDGEALFGYSDIAGPTEPDFSTSEKWLTSLALKINDKDQLIGAYNGGFQQSRLFIRQDEGTQSSNQLMTHNLSAAVKKHFGEDLVFKPVFFYNTVWVKETADESLGDGLYDYTDIGGGFQNTHRLQGPEGKVRELTYAFNAFLREYPNYRTLEALSSRDPLEDKEKDFIGYKADVSYRTEWWFETTAQLSGTALFKDFTDKHTVNFNGVRENENRQDFYAEAGGSVFKPVTETLNVGFSSGWKANYSNLDFYDTRNTLALTDDRFFENYFDYHSYELRPTVTFDGPKFAAAAKPSSVQVSYAFEKTFYVGRTAQDIAGVLLNEDQEDRNSKINVQLDVPFGEKWSWILAGSWEKQTSNQKFEQTFLYSYESWSILSGVRFEL